MEAVDQSCHFIQKQYADNSPTSPNADLIIPDARQVNYQNKKFTVSVLTLLESEPGPTTPLPLHHWA